MSPVCRAEFCPKLPFKFDSSLLLSVDVGAVVTANGDVIPVEDADQGGSSNLIGMGVLTGIL